MWVRGVPFNKRPPFDTPFMAMNKVIEAYGEVICKYQSLTSMAPYIPCPTCNQYGFGQFPP
jgi:hypothetical protein